MEASLALQIPTYWAEAHGMRLEKGDVNCSVQRLKSVSSQRRENDFEFSEPSIESLDAFDEVHFRVDPPVDQRYVNWVQLLSASKARVTNPPNQLLSVSEKHGPLELWPYFPEMIVSSSAETLAEWAQKFFKSGSPVVLKGLGSAQSKDVELAKNTNELENIGRRLSKNWSAPMLAQQYLPEIATGEDRFWFIDGKLIASVRKHALEGDFRVLIDQGSQLSQIKPSRMQLATLKAVSSSLKQRKLRLAAVDMIGSKISDFNITSPGLLVQMEQVLDKDLAGPIVKALGVLGH